MKPSTNNHLYRKKLIGLVAIGIIVMAAATPFDKMATEFLSRHEWPVLSDIMGRTLFEGELPGANDILTFVLLTAIVLYAGSQRRNANTRQLAWRPHAAFVLLSVFVIAFLFIHGFKLSLGRARPDLVLDHKMPFTHWFSFGPHFLGRGLYRGAFPSGHTAQTFSLMSVAYVLCANPFAMKRYKGVAVSCGLFVALLSLTMAVARCMSKSHWLTDVLGSIAFGWPLMHCLFHRFLRVPDQVRYIKAHGCFPNMPVLWELRLCLFLLLLTAAIIATVNGARALFLGLNPLYALAVFLPGACLFIVAAWKIKSTVVQLDTALKKV